MKARVITPDSSTTKEYSESQSESQPGLETAPPDDNIADSDSDSRPESDSDEDLTSTQDIEAE